MKRGTAKFVLAVPETTASREVARCLPQPSVYGPASPSIKI